MASSAKTLTAVSVQWSTITIDREFEPEDIQKASIDSRVIALVGATGTAKTKARWLL